MSRAEGAHPRALGPSGWGPGGCGPRRLTSCAPRAGIARQQQPTSGAVACGLRF
jgi:hypothetical protein